MIQRSGGGSGEEPQLRPDGTIENLHELSAATLEKLMKSEGLEIICHHQVVGEQFTIHQIDGINRYRCIYPEGDTETFSELLPWLLSMIASTVRVVPRPTSKIVPHQRRKVYRQKSR